MTYLLKFYHFCQHLAVSVMCHLQTQTTMMPFPSPLGYDLARQYCMICIKELRCTFSGMTRLCQVEYLLSCKIVLIFIFPHSQSSVRTWNSSLLRHTSTVNLNCFGLCFWSDDHVLTCVGVVEISSFIQGYHVYQEIWTPGLSKEL